MMDEKQAHDIEAPLLAKDGKDIEELRVGGEENNATAGLKRVKGFSTVKSFILGFLGFWVFGRFISSSLSGGSVPHSLHGHALGAGVERMLDPSEWFDESSAVITHADYLNPSLYYMDGDKPVYIANATFPSTYRGCHRQIAVEIDEGVNAGVVIAREDVEATTLRVESAWYEDGMGDNIKLIQSGGNDILRLSAMEGLHSVTIILPLNANRIPTLHLSGPSHPAILFEDSASNTEFTHLHIESEKKIVLENIKARDVQIKSDTGSVSGTFNVTNAVVFKTVTGDIKVTVNVQPQAQHNHTEGVGHKHGEDRHGGEHHGDEEHHKRSQDGCAGGIWARVRALFSHKHGHGHKDKHDHDHKHKHKHEHKHKHHGHHPHGPPPPPPPPPPHHPPHHPPHDHPHGPSPVFIGAFTTTGHISLTINQPANVSTITKAFSHTGDVTVDGSKEFKGYFEAGTRVGNVSVVAGEGKEIEVIKEDTTEVGGFVKGLIKFRGDDEEDDDDQDDDDDDDEEEDDDMMKEWLEEMEEDNAEDMEEPHGPHPPHGPPPPHKGPGGPPPPPPHRGPGGPHEHHRPPPPGFSKLFAGTDVGAVKVAL